MNTKRKRDGTDGTEPVAKKQKIEASNTVGVRVMDDKLRAELEEIVEECMKDFDGSHDFFHVGRVRNLAIGIAKKEGIKDLELVELIALLHDVNDHKYIANDSNKNNEKIKAILNKYEIYSEAQNKINEMIDYVSFSKEIKIKNDIQNKGKYSQYLSFIRNHPALACVQDADRLDGIGAIGIARTFTFGGAKDGRALFNYPLQSQNNKNTKQCDVNEWTKSNRCNGTTIGHFYDKLFLLKDMMKTKTGKQIAIQRHEIMKQFVSSFLNEWQGKLN